MLQFFIENWVLFVTGIIVTLLVRAADRETTKINQKREWCRILSKQNGWDFDRPEPESLPENLIAPHGSLRHKQAHDAAPTQPTADQAQVAYIESQNAPRLAAAAASRQAAKQAREGDANREYARRLQVAESVSRQLPKRADAVAAAKGGEQPINVTGEFTGLKGAAWLARQARERRKK